MPRKAGQARAGRLQSRRGSLERLQAMADAERARRALQDATKVAIEVKHAGNTAAAKAHGKAKLRWMSAARSVIDSNKKRRREGRAARPAPPGGAMHSARGPPKGALTAEQLDDLKKQNTKRPPMRRVNSHGVAKVI